MIETRKYSCSGSRYEHDAMDDLPRVVELCQHDLLAHGSAHVTLEPGDVTRYEFMLVHLPRDEMVLVFLNDFRGWAVKISRTSFTVPDYLAEHICDGHEPNPCTLAVACDLINLVRQSDNDHRFYDWETGRIR